MLTRPLPRFAATSATELLALFKKRRTHAAVVIDDHGGTLGFVTLDDLVEDLIDEEEPADSDWIRKTPDGGFSLDGEATLTELAEDYGMDFAESDVVTVAGLVLSKRGVAPKQGDHVECSGFRLTVEETQGFKITRVPPGSSQAPKRRKPEVRLPPVPVADR